MFFLKSQLLSEKTQAYSIRLVGLSQCLICQKQVNVGENAYMGGNAYIFVVATTHSNIIVFVELN